MTVRPGNAQHQGARDAQQDSFAFSDLEDRAFVAHAGFLGIVADGMGGMAHGGAAGATAVRALLEAYALKRPEEPIPRALLRSITAANQAVAELARSTGRPDDVGTTAAVVVVHDAALHWASVGDSRVYLWRGGRLAQVTADHVYAADLDAKVAAGQLSAQDAAQDPDREALTSHLGGARVRTIDRSVRPFPLFEGDRVLVCSDGLYRALTLEELAAPLAGNPQRACETLVAQVVARRLERQDNLTAIVIGLDPDGVTTDTPDPSSYVTRATQVIPRSSDAESNSAGDAAAIDRTARVERMSETGGGIAAWFKRFGAMVVCTFALLGGPFAAARAQAQELARVPSAVVHLFTMPSEGDVYKTGSGFVINTGGTIITNQHVVDLVLSAPGRIYVMDDHRARELEPRLRGANVTMENALSAVIQGAPTASVVWADAAKDLAILSLDTRADVTPLPLAASNVVEIGDRVVAFGFPGVNTLIGAASMVVLDRRPGEITSKHHEARRNRDIYSTSVKTYRGMSGGPAVNACGEVIGIIFGGFSRELKRRDQQTQEDKLTGFEEVDLLIRVDTLLPELDARNIPYERVTTRCAAASGGASGGGASTGGGGGGAASGGFSEPPPRDAVLTGGVIAAIVLGLIAVALAATKRGRSAVKSATDSVTRSLSPRKPAPAAAPARGASPAPGPQPPPRATVPLLYGLSGEYGGVELELSRDPVAIGRDPRVSHLVFSADTGIVSGRHCAVWFDPQAKSVMLEDLWSTNGTFLGNGRRLEGGRPYPLRSADQFYLGDPEVLFEVRF